MLFLSLIHIYAFEITPSFAYSDTGNLYFKFERGFTSPSANKMQNKDRVKGYYPSNIKSEKFLTYEVGMRDLVLEQFFQATAFYTKSKDEITTDMVGMGEQWKQYNIGKTEKLSLIHILARALKVLIVSLEVCQEATPIPIKLKAQFKLIFVA